MPDAAAMGLEPAEIKAIITRMKRAHGHLGSVIRHDGGPVACQRSLAISASDEVEHPRTTPGARAASVDRRSGGQVQVEVFGVSSYQRWAPYPARRTRRRVHSRRYAQSVEPNLNHTAAATATYQSMMMSAVQLRRN